MKILVDTSVFISIFAKDVHFDGAIKLFRDIITGHEGSFCSMTVNEIIWVLRRGGYNAKFIGEKVDFLFLTPFKYFSVSKEVFDGSIKLMEKFNLDYGDSQIVAQAITNSIDRIASFDKDFDRVSEIERIENI
ncbi:MAG: type II toxin-antitoxin system VapC family toxin [Halobacteriota archaeon]|nr:type II toxin-antitoxin system VapC family toxin [Halobacteriota archaeon]